MPKELADKVKSFYGYTISRIVHKEEEEIISGLSMSLRMQVRGTGFTHVRHAPGKLYDPGSDDH